MASRDCIEPTMLSWTLPDWLLCSHCRLASSVYEIGMHTQTDLTQMTTDPSSILLWTICVGFPLCSQCLNSKDIGRALDYTANILRLQVKVQMLYSALQLFRTMWSDFKRYNQNTCKSFALWTWEHLVSTILMNLFGLKVIFPENHFILLINQMVCRKYFLISVG